MTPEPRLGIVTGLPAEARAAHAGNTETVRVLCCHASTARAESLTRSLVDWGAAGLLSFGTGGGLRPELPAGTVVIATAIVDHAGNGIATDEKWGAQLVEALTPPLRAVRAPVAGADRPVADVAAKAALGHSSKAAVVDMESHAVARVCASAGLPAMAIRVIADPANRRLPRSVVAALSAGSGPLARRVLMETRGRPGDLPGLARLAVDYGQALRALRRVAALGGPRFGFGV